MSYQENENTKIKLAVIGSRTFTDKERLYRILDNNYDRIGMIVSGGAAGADTLAQEWAKDRGFPCVIYYARWRDLEGNYDKGAGFRRNGQIIRQADKVLAIWDGVSGGTLNSMSIAEKLGKPITVVKFTPPPKEPKKRGRKKNEDAEEKSEEAGSTFSL